MNTTTVKKSEKKQSMTNSSNMEISTFIGELFSFNSSLKLYHWSVTGTGSYAKHMALDEAIASLLDVIDRITETTYALVGDLHISIPETKTPDNITKHVSEFYNHVPLIFFLRAKHIIQWPTPSSHTDPSIPPIRGPPPYR